MASTFEPKRKEFLGTKLSYPSQNLTSEDSAKLLHKIINTERIVKIGCILLVPICIMASLIASFLGYDNEQGNFVFEVPEIISYRGAFSGIFIVLAIVCVFRGTQKTSVSEYQQQKTN